MSMRCKKILGFLLVSMLFVLTPVLHLSDGTAMAQEAKQQLQLQLKTNNEAVVTWQEENLETAIKDKYQVWNVSSNVEATEGYKLTVTINGDDYTIEMSIAEGYGETYEVKENTSFTGTINPVYTLTYEGKTYYGAQIGGFKLTKNAQEIEIEDGSVTATDGTVNGNMIVANADSEIIFTHDGTGATCTITVTKHQLEWKQESYAKTYDGNEVTLESFGVKVVDANSQAIEGVTLTYANTNGTAVDANTTAAGEYTVTAAFTNENYALPTTNATITIDQKQVTVSAPTRFFYGEEKKEENQVKVDGLGKDQYEVKYGESWPNKGSHSIEITLKDPNYTFEQGTTETVSITIDPAKLELTLAGNNNFPYDNSTELQSLLEECEVKDAAGNTFTDYTLVYTNAELNNVEVFGTITDAGNYSVKAVPNDTDNYAESSSVDIAIGQKDVKINLPEDSYVYGDGANRAVEVIGIIDGDTNTHKVEITNNDTGESAALEDAGTYTVKVKLGANYKTSDDTEKTVTIAPAQLTLKLAGNNNFPYDNSTELQSLLEECEVKDAAGNTFTDYKLVYTNADSNNGTVYGTITAAGNYSVQAVPNDTDNYDASDLVAIKIDQKPVTITLPEDSYIYGDGKNRDVEVIGTIDGDTNAYKVKITKNGEEVAALEDAGTYTVMVELGTNYKTSGATEKIVTIAPAKLTLTHNPEATYTYTDDNLAEAITNNLKVEAPNVDGDDYTFVFSADPVNAGTYADPVNAGPYTVFAKAENSNYSDSESVEVEISPAQLTLTHNPEATYTYTGDNLADVITNNLKVEAPNVGGNDYTFVFSADPVDAGTYADPVNAGTYTVFAKAENSNYSDSESVEVVVSPKPVRVTFPENFTYGESQTVTVSDGLTENTDYTVECKGENDEQWPNVGTYTVTVTVDANYTINETNEQTSSRNVEISKNQLTLTLDGNNNFTYNNRTELQSLLAGCEVKDAAGNPFTDYTLVYTNAELNNVEVSGTITAAGNYRVKAVPNDTDNYAESGSVDIAIGQKDVAINLPEDSYVYGDGANRAVEVIGTIAGDTNAYNVKITKNGEEAAALEDAGTYTVVVELGANYKTSGATEKIVTISPAALTLTHNPDATYTYTGSTLEEVIETNLQVTAPDVANDDYEFVYSDTPINAGTYTVKANSKNGNYSNSADVSVTVAANQLTLTLAAKNFTYDGDDKSDNIGARVTGAVALANPEQEYTLKYFENGKEVSGMVAAGTYQVQAVATSGNCLSSAPVEIVIAENVLNLELGVSEFIYDGSDKSDDIAAKVTGKSAAYKDIESEYDLTFYNANGEEVEEIIDAGAYTVRASATSDNSKASNAVAVTIHQNLLTLSAQGTTDMVYDGVDSINEIGLIVTPAAPLHDSVKDDYKIVICDDAGVAVDAVINAGTYAAKIETQNASFAVSANIAVVIEPFQVQITPVADQTTTYGVAFNSDMPMFSVTKVTDSEEPADYNAFVNAVIHNSNLKQVVAAGIDLPVGTYQVASAGIPAEFANNYVYFNQVNKAKITVSYLVTDAKVSLTGNLNPDTNEYYAKDNAVTLIAPEGYTIVANTSELPSVMKTAATVDYPLDGVTPTCTQYFRLMNAAGAVTDVLSVSYNQDLANQTELLNREIKSYSDKVSVYSNEALKEGVVIDLVYTPHTTAKRIESLTGVSSIAKGGLETQVAFTYKAEAVFGAYKSVQYVPADSVINVRYTDVAGHEKVIAQIPVASWKPLSIDPITGYNTTAAGIAVINENGYTFTIHGEPGQIVAMSYNGQVDYIQLNAQGVATYAPAFVEHTPAGVPQVQTLQASYAHVEFAGNAAVTAINFMYDNTSYEAFMVVPETMENRAKTLSVILPEYGYVTSVTAYTTAYSTVKTYQLYTAAGVTDEYSDGAEQIVPISGTRNMPQEGYVEVEFVDLAGHSHKEQILLTPSTDEITIDSIVPARNDNERIRAGDVIVTISGTPDESFRLRLSDHTTIGVFPQTGTIEITVPNEEIERNTTVNATVSYVNMNGTNTSGNFIYDDYVAEPMIITTVHENAYFIAGYVETASEVYISYPDFPEIGRTAARVDAYGFFVAELDMLAEGEQVRVMVMDLAGNVANTTVAACSEDDVDTVAAFPMGKLYVDRDNENRQWLNATNVTREELIAGVTLPILANNCFVVGEFTAQMDENGMVTYHYELDESLAELVDCYMTLSTKYDYDDFATHALEELQMDQGVETQKRDDEFWIYAEFELKLDEDAVVETFQMEKLSESEMRRQYILYQRR